MDSPDYEWERIDICIYNPPTYNIERATITLDIPETIDYKVSTDLNSIFRYDPSRITFTIENFGNYNESVQCDWFEIRPRIDSVSEKETINLSYKIEYTSQIPGKEKGSVIRFDSISVLIKWTEMGGELCSAFVPQFGSPGIAVNPQNLSFNMDSPDYEWEKIDVCIYNPKNYNINVATIKLDIPDTIEYKINTDLNSVFNYDPTSTTFTINNFGNFKGSTQCDWFEIRPRIDSISKKETINLFYEIEYTSQIPGMEKGSVTRNDNISVIIKKSENGITSIIQDNVWFVAIASLFCSIILLIFGPGSERRIDSIKRKIKK